MAPRQPKPKPDDNASTTPSPLKPKTEKAKVEKTKTDKPKTEKAKAVKAEKVEKALKADKPEKVVKPKAPKAAATEEKPGEKAAKPAAVKKEKAGEKDGKEKVKPVGGEEAVALIAAYLKGQNRPYSATEVSANLHNKVTKTNADKLMKEMAENNLIMAKATNGTNKGSQWVFWALQDANDAATPEELAQMETSINTLRETLPALKISLKILNTKLATLRSAPTTSQLATMVSSLREANYAKAEKLRGYKEGTVKMVTTEELERVEKAFKYWGARRKARKNGFLNLEAQLLEGYSREDIWEKVGVEGDSYEVDA